MYCLVAFIYPQPLTLKTRCTSQFTVLKAKNCLEAFNFMYHRISSTDSTLYSRINSTPWKYFPVALMWMATLNDFMPLVKIQNDLVQ